MKNAKQSTSWLSKLSFAAMLGVMCFKGDACICGGHHPPPMPDTTPNTSASATPPPPPPG